MRITDVTLTPMQICGDADGNAMAVEIKDGFEYLDGKKTDNHTHKVVEAVMTKNKYEKLKVKVMNTKTVITNEQIAQQGGSVKVKFKNLTGKFYRKNTTTCRPNRKQSSIINRIYIQ